MGIKQWFRENVLKKEINEYVVVYNYKNEKYVRINVVADSKADAKKDIDEFIKNSAIDSNNYSFVRVGKLKWV